MIGANAQVIMHRPPRQPLRGGSRSAPASAESIYQVDRTHETAEHERIWGLVRQSAEGCNPAGAKV